MQSDRALTRPMPVDTTLRIAVATLACLVGLASAVDGDLATWRSGVAFLLGWGYAAVVLVGHVRAVARGR